MRQENDENIRIQPFVYAALDLPPNLEIRPAPQRLPVINDSEALQYVGKAVEVRGLVFAVSINPLGTVFTHFGREYPDQTFA